MTLEEQQRIQALRNAYLQGVADRAAYDNPSAQMNRWVEIAGITLSDAKGAAKRYPMQQPRVLVDSVDCAFRFVAGRIEARAAGCDAFKPISGGWFIDDERITIFASLRNQPLEDV